MAAQDNLSPGQFTAAHAVAGFGKLASQHIAWSKEARAAGDLQKSQFHAREAGAVRKHLAWTKEWVNRDPKNGRMSQDQVHYYGSTNHLSPYRNKNVRLP